MRRIAIICLFPYLLPLVAISAITFAWMLATPDDPRFAGPNEGDVLGVYFIGICVIVGGIVQALIGVPFCLLLARGGARWFRISIAVIAAILGILPFGLIMAQSPHSEREILATAVTVIGCFTVGAWIPYRRLFPRTALTEQFVDDNPS